MAELTLKNSIEDHQVVSSAEWLAARKELLRKKKNLPATRSDKPDAPRTAVGEARKELCFRWPAGKETLADLFGGKSQLIVYHFMFGPGWEEGCPSCSFLGDHFEGSLVHLANRDVSFVAVSRAPSARLKPSKSAWAGASSGCRHSGMTLTLTTTFHSPKMTSRSTRRITTTRIRISHVKKLRAQPCFTKTPPEISSTRTQPTGADSTFC